MLGVQIPPGLPINPVSKQGNLIMDYINRLKIFLNEVKIEMKKVSWPTRKETMYTTSAVIISVFLISFFLGLVDLGLSKLIERLIK